MEPTARRPPVSAWASRWPAGPSGPPSRAGQRRRPSGEAPPLPRALNRSGRIWLAAAGGILLLWAGLVANQGTAVRMLELDHAVVEWVAGMRTELLTDVMQTVHALGSRWTIRVLFWSTVAALVVLRRFRHLFVFGRGHPGRDRPHRPARLRFRLAPAPGRGDPGRLERLRQPVAPGGRAHRHPDGRALLAGPGGPAAPPRQAGDRRAGRRPGRLPALPGRERAQRRADRRRHRGHHPPGGVPHDHPQRGLPGHLPPRQLGPPGRRRPPRPGHPTRALEDQLGVQVAEVKPFGLSGSAGSTPLRVTVKGDPETWLFAKLYAGSHLRSDRWYKLGRTLLYGRLEDEKPFNTVRRLVQQEDYALRLMHGAGVRSPEPFGIVEITPEREYLVVTEFFDDATGARRPGAGRRPHHRRRPADHPPPLGRRPGPPRHQAGQPAGPRRPGPPDRRVLRRGPPQPLAPGGRPGQHDARSWPPAPAASRSTGGPGSSSTTTRSPRRSPPPAASPCPPSSAGPCATRAATCTPSSCGCCPSWPRPIAIQRWSIRRVGLMIGVALLALLALADGPEQLRGGGAAVRRRLLLLATACLVLAGCAWPRPRPASPRPASRAAATRGGEGTALMVLIAQAVPTASQLPCVELKPAGWTVSDVFVRNGRVRFALDSDRVGQGAVQVVLQQFCAIGQVHQGALRPSRAPAATRRSSRSSRASATRGRSTTCSPAAA